MNEQIEAIRNEIKRLEEIHERNLKKPMERGRIGFAHGVVECCDRILSFIDSLPEETDNGVDITDFCKPINPGIAQCIADHWWEMLDNEEPNRPKLSDSLEEAAEKYEEEHTYQRYDGGGFTPEYNATLVEAFLAGAEWQKKEMLKDAVEGTVHNFSSNKPHPTVLVDAKGFNQGEKVHIIIVKNVKEDEQ